MNAERRFLTVTGEMLTGPEQIVLEVPRSAVPSLALELALLVEGLAESLRIQANARKEIVLTMTEGERVATAAVRRDRDGSVRFALGRNQAEYLYMSLLHAYREPASAIGVEVAGECDGSDLELSIMFEPYRAPASAR